MPCTTRNDAACVNCSLLFVQPQDLTEYFNQGSCETRCIAGYYADPIHSDKCLSCTQQSLTCSPGFRPSSLCIEPTERITQPTCEACTTSSSTVLGPHEVWSTATAFCSKRCSYSYVPLLSIPSEDIALAIIAATSNLNLSTITTSAQKKQILNNNTGCVLCTAALCGLGSMGACLQTDQSTVELQCFPCSSFALQPQNTRYIAAGECTLTCIDANMQPLLGNNPATGGCALPPPPPTTPPPSSITTKSASTMGGKAYPELVYPTRPMTRRTI